MFQRIAASRRSCAAGVAAMIMLIAAVAEAQTSTWEPGTQITAKRAFRMTAPNTAEQCRDACLANSNCRAWDFQARRSPTGRPRGRCDHFTQIIGKRTMRGRYARTVVAGIVSPASRDTPTAAPEPRAAEDRATGPAPAPALEPPPPGATALAPAIGWALAVRASAIAAALEQEPAAPRPEAPPYRTAFAALKHVPVPLRPAAPPSADAPVAAPDRARGPARPAAPPAETTTLATPRHAPAPSGAPSSEPVPAPKPAETPALARPPELPAPQADAAAPAKPKEAIAAREPPPPEAAVTKEAPPQKEAPVSQSEAPSQKDGRSSSWEPGLSLMGQAFAYDKSGAGTGYALADAQACRDLCLKHAQCRGWQFNGADYAHPRLRNLCFLYSRAPARIGSGIFGVISGVVEEPRPSGSETRGPR